VEFVGGDDAEFRVAIFPPELMADDGYVHGACRFWNCFGYEDDACCCEEERDHNQNRDDCPREFDLVTAVDLSRFTVGVCLFMPEANQRVEQQPGDYEKYDQCDGKHQHRQAKGRACGRASGIEDVGGRLRAGCTGDQRNAARCTPQNLRRTSPGFRGLC